MAINTIANETETVTVTVATIKDGYVTLCGTMDYEEINWDEMEDVTSDGWSGWGTVYADTTEGYDTVYIIK